MAVAKNLGGGGAALDAQYGSSASSNTNEPLLLTHTGENYLYLPGSSSNYALVPDSAALDITGDIEFQFRLAMDDWTPSVNQLLFNKASGVATDFGYSAQIETAGTILFRWSANGTTRIDKYSTAALTATDGVPLWVRITLDVDNGAAGNDVKFFQAADSNNVPTVWTQVGATVTTAGVTSVFPSTQALGLGGENGAVAANLAGKLYRARILNGIGGTVALDVDFTTGITSGAQATFTESSSNAATVTINRSSSGRKSVAVVRTVWLLGTDDYFEVADNDLLDFGLTDSFTVWAVYRNWSTLVRNVGLVAKKQDTGTGNAGWVLYQLDSGPQATAMIGDGTNRPYVDGGNAGSAGVARMSAMVRDVAADNVIAYSRVGSASALTSDNTTATIANALAMRIGRFAGAGTAYADIELIAAGVHRRALSATELAQIAAYYGVA